MDYNFLKTNDFEYVGYKYEDSALISRTALHKRGSKLRVYYYLPNGNHCYHNSLPPLKSKREMAGYLAEFNHALSTGYLPLQGALNLRMNSYDPKDGRFPIFLKKYFEDYSKDERSKGDNSRQMQESVARRFVAYFEGINIHSISDITDDHLTEWDQSLKFTLKLKGSGFIAPATRNSWRKTLRAFLNTAKEQGYALRCHPEQMNIHEYGKGGKIDITADARLVIYPLKLIEAVEKCSYPLDLETVPDIRKIIRLWREIGIRPMEMFSLNESNIIFANNHPVELRIKELKDCPNNKKMDFIPKNKKSYREVQLTDWASQYIESLLQKFKGVKRYGKFQKGLVEYPFLFVFWDEKKQAFIREDQKLIDLFKDITAYANKEFDLSLRDDYILYDLRRSCNLYLKLELGYQVKDAARFLGHSEITNLKHYSLDEDQIKIEKSYASNSLQHAAQTNPDVRKRYSFHLGKDKKNDDDEPLGVGA